MPCKVRRALGRTLTRKLPNSATTTATTANVVHQHCVAADLENLEALMRSKHALPVLMALKTASEEVVDMIQCEMEAAEGKTWLIFVGAPDQLSRQR